MSVKDYLWESFQAIQAAVTFTHHLADCYILLFIFSSILSHVWNNCWLQFEAHACAALSVQPWRCHPLHTKLSIVYALAFFYCNDNNYGWKNFANDEVVRARIWNIWFQLFLIQVSSLSQRSWRNILGAELCLYKRHEAVPRCVCAKQGAQNSQFWHLGAEPSAQGAPGSPERALQTKQTQNSVL